MASLTGRGIGEKVDGGTYRGASEREAAARAVEVLSVRNDVEDADAVGYVEVCESPPDSELRKFVAKSSHSPDLQADPHALVFSAGDTIQITSTSWDADDNWVHGRTLEGPGVPSRVGGFPPQCVEPPRAPTTNEVSLDHERVVQMHSGSVRGADWGKHFALVRKEVLLRLAKQNRAAELRGARLKEERRVGAVAISINTHPPCKIRHTHTVCALQAGASIHRGLLLRSYGG
jgi:hypothetical protein